MNETDPPRASNAGSLTRKARRLLLPHRPAQKFFKQSFTLCRIELKLLVLVLQLYLNYFNQPRCLFCIQSPAVLM